MAGIYSNSFRVIIFLRVLIGIAHMQDCQQEKHLAIAAHTSGDVNFISDPYIYARDRFFPLSDLLLERQRLHRRLSRISLRKDTADVLPYDSDIDGEAHVERVGNDSDSNVLNVTFTMSDISETDNDVYILHDRYVGVTLNCWSLYVLGEWKYDTSQSYFEEGTLLGVTDFFPHLSETIVQNMTVSTSWQLEDRVITDRVPLHTTRDMNGKSLTYTIQGPDHSPASVNYILNISYTGPIVFEPNRTAYALRTGGTLQSITCNADCNPTCEVTWEREGVVISNDTILEPGSVLLGTTEYVCHVTNTATGKQLRERIFIYGIEEREESNTLVYVLASLTAVLGLVSAALVVLLCRRGSCSCTKPWVLQRKPHTDAVEMGAETVAASAAPDDSTVSREVPYEDLQGRDGQENTYDGICTDKEDQQADDGKTTYENLF